MTNNPPPEGGKQVPGIWRRDDCKKHTNYDSECLACREEILTVQTQTAFLAGRAQAEAELAGLNRVILMHEASKEFLIERVKGLAEMLLVPISGLTHYKNENHTRDEIGRELIAILPTSPAGTQGPGPETEPDTENGI